MTVAIPWRHKREAPRSVAIAKSRLPLSSTVASLFVLSPANFGQPPLAHLYRLFRSSLSKLSLHFHRQPPEETRKKIRRRNQASTADYGSTLGVVRVASLDACRDVPLHRRQNLSSFSFPCTHPAPASSWTALRQWGEYHVSFAPSEFSLSRSVSEYIFHLVTFALLEEVALILLSNLGMRFCLRGVGCDAPGFQPGLLTLMIRSTELTLVKQLSTWAITSKPSPTTPNGPFWSTLVNPWSNATQNPLNTPLPSSVSRNFCHVLQISPKYFKFSQYKSCVVFHGTQLSCWAAFLVRSGNGWKMQVNTSGYYSQAPRK
jgi:hypothetical protein